MVGIITREETITTIIIQIETSHREVAATAQETVATVITVANILIYLAHTVIMVGLVVVVLIMVVRIIQGEAAAGLVVHQETK
jgi:hypothetical protein